MKKIIAKFITLEMYRTFEIDKTFIDVLIFGKRIAKFVVICDVIAGRTTLKKV